MPKKETMHEQKDGFDCFGINWIKNVHKDWVQKQLKDPSEESLQTYRKESSVDQFQSEDDQDNGWNRQIKRTSALRILRMPRAS